MDARAFTRVVRRERRRCLRASSPGKVFALPAVRARHLGPSWLDGLSVGGDTMIQPYLRVMPMGWHCALHFCQSAVTRGVESFVGADKMVVDRRGGLVFDSLRSIGGCAYVDNFGTFGVTEAAAESKRNETQQLLEDIGLCVQECESASQNCEFLGLEVSEGRFPVPSRPLQLPTNHSG